MQWDMLLISLAKQYNRLHWNILSRERLLVIYSIASSNTVRFNGYMVWHSDLRCHTTHFDYLLNLPCSEQILPVSESADAQTAVLVCLKLQKSLSVSHVCI